MEDVIQSTISLPPKEEINKLSKHREWNLKCNITYNLKEKMQHLLPKEKEVDIISMKDVTQKCHLQTKEKRKEFHRHGWCDLKHDITHLLRKKEMNLVSTE